MQHSMVHLLVVVCLSKLQGNGLFSGRRAVKDLSIKRPGIKYRAKAYVLSTSIAVIGNQAERPDLFHELFCEPVLSKLKPAPSLS